MADAAEMTDDDGSDAVEAEAAALRDGDEDRKWLLVIFKMTESLFTSAEIECPRARIAYERFLENAFDRATRIMRSDFPPSER